MPWGGTIPVTQDKAIKSGFRAGKKKSLIKPLIIKISVNCDIFTNMI